MITESESKSLESVYPEIANHPLPTAEEMEVILDRFKVGEKGADEELKNAYIRFVLPLPSDTLVRECPKKSF